MARIERELLAELNRCRFSLHDTFRSDISTGGGKTISLKAMKGNKNWTLDQYIWPPQTNLHLKAWGNFQASLTSTHNLLRTLAISSSLKIGTWHADAHSTGWVYSKHQDRVLIHTKAGWQAYSPIIRIQGVSSHREFRKVDGDINFHSP